MSNDRLKYGHLWIDRLQEMPQYLPVVEKLLQGQSLNDVADWLMEQPDRGPFSHLKRSTLRYYLNALSIRLKENARESKNNERTLRAERLTRLADEFSHGMTPGTDVAAKKPEPTDQEIKAMQDRDLKSLIDKLTSDRLVRLMLKKHLRYIERLEEMEEASNEPVNGWERCMDVLNDAATILQKNEISQQLLDARVRTPSPVPERQLSEEAQRIARLTEVDRHLIRSAGETYLTLLKRRREEGTQG